jgi:WD40 repeat protein
MKRCLPLTLIFLALVAARTSPPHEGATPLRAEEDVLPEMIVQLGHGGNFVFVARYSADGRFVVTGGSDSKAKLWDARTGAEIRRFEGHTGNIRCAAFSPNGRFVVTGSGDTLMAKDHTVRLWDVATGKELKQFVGHADSVKAVAFSHDGRYVLTGSGNALRDGTDFTARVWDVETAAEVRRFTGHTSDVNSVAFSPNDAFVLTGSEDGTAALWEVASGRMVRKFEGHTGFVNAVAFSADGRQVLTGSSARVGVGDGDNSARLWDAGTGLLRRRFDGHTDGVNSVALSPDGRFVLTAGTDKTAVLWDRMTARRVVTYRGHTDVLRSATFSPDGSTVLTAGDDSTARQWDTLKGREINSLKGYSALVSCAAFSPDGRFVATGDWDGTGHLWDLSSGREVRRYEGHTAEIRAVAFSPDGRLVLTGGGDKTARLWEAATGKLLWQLPQHSESVTSVAFSPDGRRLLTLDSLYMEDRQESHGIMRLWGLGSRTELKRFGEFVDALAFSSDGTRVATGGDDGDVRIYRTEGGAEIARWHAHDADINTIAFSSDDRLILTGSGDFHEREYTARMWDAATRNQLQVFIGHTSDVNSVAFSRDNRFALTASSDKTAILWDVRTGAEVRRFEGHADGVSAAAFSPNGDLVLTASSDQTSRLWETSSGGELCRMITFGDGTWFVADREGRFDTNNLERVEGLHWVMRDDPLTALPAEIFMQPYFEPRLLPRLVAVEEFRPAPSFASLNRVQPKVTIVGATLDGPYTAAVTVEVQKTRRRFERRGGEVVESGAQDLRLFRDSQLAAYRDGDLFGRAPGRSTACESVAGDPDKCRAVFEKVMLPRQPGVRDVAFSAYAFNTSGVKSETHQLPFPFTTGVPPVKGRAYLISVGVNSHQNPSWDLEFAAADARRVHETVGAHLRASGAYGEVVDVLLTSELKAAAGVAGPPRLATKENFRKLVRLLAGEEQGEEFFAAFPEARRLHEATPDDMILIFYSSHGYRDEEQFYLFPYDIGEGAGRAITDELLRHCVASSDLSRWLRDVDAGDTVLIVDACHAAAAVSSGDFKPGPMGSSGMGQLAYDKGMRVLAATQSETTAAEVNFEDERLRIKQGLLTYALVEMGLVEGRANVNGDAVILAPEWLQYGVASVPPLYAELRRQAARAQDQEAVAVIRGAGEKGVRLVSKGRDELPLQQPTLFDFTGKLRRQRPLVIAKKS